MTNLTPAQLEEFEQAFRHFDKDNCNTLSATEFNAALASLGVFYDDGAFDEIFARVTDRQEKATFEQFIRFMVSVTEDKASPDQIRDAFQTMAGDKPYVTEMDLRMCLIPQEVIDHLKQDMPARDNGLDYDAYIHNMFN